VGFKWGLTCDATHLFHLHVLARGCERERKMQLALSREVGEGEAAGDAAYVEEGDDTGGWWRFGEDEAVDECRGVGCEVGGGEGGVAVEVEEEEGGDADEFVAGCVRDFGAAPTCGQS